MRALSTLGIAVVAMFAATATAWAQAPVTSIDATMELADEEKTVMAPGAPDSPEFSTSTTYRVKYGAREDDEGNDLTLAGLSTSDADLGWASAADRIVLRRVDNELVTGDRHVAAFERVAFMESRLDLAPSLAQDMGTVLLGPVINRGVVNVFANAGEGDGNNNNIERIDYLWDGGISVPADMTSEVGFAVMERGGNDTLLVAAVTAVNEDGDPTELTAPTRIAAEDWGGTGYSFPVTVLRADSEDGPLRPVSNETAQGVAGVFLSFDDLGVGGDTRIYGYVLLPDDLPDMVQPLDLEQMSTNTNASAGGVDLMSGGGAFMANDSLMVDLSVDITSSTEKVKPGGSATYTITVENAGPADAIDAHVRTELPEALTDPTWTCRAESGARCNEGPIDGTLDDHPFIPVDGRAVYELQASVAKEASGSVAPTASVRAALQRDVEPMNDDAAAETPLGGGGSGGGSGGGCGVAATSGGALPGAVMLGLLWLVGVRRRTRRRRGQ